MKLQLAVSVKANVVTLEVILRDAYEAQVYFDDVIGRLQSGDGISLKFDAPPQTGIYETIEE
jgi:hypothetical protein